MACLIPIGPPLACLIPIGLYQMVKEALHERANLLEIAPHLSFPLPIMLPVYRWWQVRSKLFIAF
jgi:glycerol-3-phosphate dehydrogenase